MAGKKKSKKVAPRGKQSLNQELQNSLTDIPKRRKKISMIDAYNQGLLANKPAGKVSDYFKSVLYSVKDGVTLAERILIKQGELAEKGDSKAAEFLFDRAYGRPTQNIQVETPPQVIVEHNVISVEEAKASASEEDTK
jgi:hypothetical protein